MNQMKFCKWLIALVVLMINATAVIAGVPDVHVNDKFPAGNGAFTKVSYSDIFSTNIDGESIEMRVAYAVPMKDHPSVIIEILTKQSTIYQEMLRYVNTLNSVSDKFVYTGKRICDIIVDGKSLWMMDAKYAVAGSSLSLIRQTYDDLGSSQQECIGITFPLSFMDSSKYNYNGKNHWKDMQADLCNGDCKAIEYWFTDPVTKEKVSVTLPITSDMVLAIQRVVKAYK